ncbi:MAG: phosphatidylserine decarboxylase [Holosporales bacterium]|nr:phosphatidylserine decarboxylase [Holosporales bacterium]
MSLVGFNFAVHREGFLFVGIGACLTLVCTAFSASMAMFFAVLSIFCAFFFRNPKRSVPIGKDLIVSPADGTVCGIVLDTPPVELGLGEEKRYRISVFLSIFNVHINRLPVSGRVKNVIYRPGSFINAAIEKASIFNEKNTIIIEIDGDKDNVIAFSQIAGMIARRIVCDAHEGQTVNKGEIFGLIRFGSRCDIWLPVGTAPLVANGQTMIAGETVLADMSVKEGSPRESVVI